MILGILYVAPDSSRLPKCLQRATEMLDEELDDNSKMAAAMMLLSCCNLTGDMDRAATVAARGRVLVRNHHSTPFVKMWWHLRHGYFLTSLGRCAEAEIELGLADSIAEAHGFRHQSTNTALIGSYLALNRVVTGDLAGARRAHDKVAAVQDDLRPMSRWHTVESRMTCELAAGNFDLATHLGEICIEYSEASGMIYIQLVSRCHHAIALAAIGRRQPLAAQLATIRRMARGTCFRRFEYVAILLESWDELAHGDHGRGCALLSAAFESIRVGEPPFPHPLLATEMFRDLMGRACDASIAFDQVAALIRRYRLAAPRLATDRWPWPVKLRTLGRFEIEVEGTPLRFSGKAPKKPLALLKAVIALGPSAVPAAALRDALWPDEEAVGARKSLDITIARLRKLLGRSEAIIVSDDAVSLDARLVWVDAWSFARMADSVEAAVDPVTARTLACEQYAGAFLPGDSDVSWTFERREQLRSRFVRLTEVAAAGLESEARWDDAVSRYHRGLEADPLAETFYQGLMRCHLAHGRHAEGMAVYRRLRQTLSVVLRIAPSEQSRSLAKSLQQEGAGRDAIAWPLQPPGP